jgi:hypothetical protein
MVTRSDAANDFEADTLNPIIKTKAKSKGQAAANVSINISNE